MAATGFIGTGTIGGPMAMRLVVGAGHALTVFDLDQDARARRPGRHARGRGRGRRR